MGWSEGAADTISIIGCLLGQCSGVPAAESQPLEKVTPGVVGSAETGSPLRGTLREDSSFPEMCHLPLERQCHPLDSLSSCFQM